MGFSLYPKAIFSTIFDITVQWLESKNIRLLLLDFDNTILPYGRNRVTPELLSWLEALRRGKISIMVVSNSGKARVRDFCDSAGLEYIQSARKPGKSGLLRAAMRFGIPINQAALAGDQIFTDVLAANRAGALSILVTPLDLSNPLLWLRHQLERPFRTRTGR